jgi:DnaJ-class molecular chaperone
MEDPYQTLGVAKTATEAEIRSAYRKLAKRHHPDVNPGQPKSEERFKAISAAYALLSDAEKRGRFDRGEIDASGAERPPEPPPGRRYYRHFGEDAGRAKYRPDESFDPDDFGSVFAEAFGRRAEGFSGRGFQGRGLDLQYQLTVDFLDAANGAVKRLALPDGRTLDVTIPAGVESGRVLRLKGQGAPGQGAPGRGEGAAAGDALIEIEVAPHPFFRREGRDILLTLPVTLQEAVLGAKVEVPTIAGTVSLTIPPGSASGTKLRLKGRGIRDGNQQVELAIVLPTEPEPELAAFLESWQPRHPFDPRRGLKAGGTR